MPDELGSAAVRITGDDSSLSSAIDNAQTRLGGSIFVIRAAGAELSRLGDTALSAFGDAVNAAASYGQQMVKIGNLTDISAADMNKVHDALLQIAEATATTPTDVANGFYYANSVLANVNESLAVTKLSAEASAIGLGSVADTTRLLSHVMSVYGLDQDQANHILNDMVIAAKAGSGQADQFASSLYKILPLAQAAGVSFDDIAAAMAAATRSGLTTNQAATAVTRVLQELIAPSQKSAEMMSSLGFSSDTANQALESLQTNIGSVRNSLEDMGVSEKNAQTVMTDFGTSQEKAQAEMQKLGLTTTQQQQIIDQYAQGVDKTNADLVQYGLNTGDVSKVVKAFNEDQDAARQRLGMTGLSATQLRDELSKPGGLYTAMQQIEQATGGNTAELEKMFPNIRALIGVLADASSKGSDYGKILHDMQTNTTDFGDAFGAVQNSMAFKLQDSQVKMQVLSIEVGERLAPAVTKLVDRLSPLIEDLADWIDKNPQVATTLIEIGVGIAGLLSALGLMFNAISGGLAVFRAFQFVLMGLGPLFAGIADFAETVAIVLLYVGDALGAVIAAIVAVVGLPVEVIAAIVAILAAVALILVFDWGGIRTKIWNALVGLWNDMKPHLVDFANFMKNLGPEIGGAVGGAFSALGTTVHNAVNAVGDAFSRFGTTVHNGLDAGLAAIKALPGEVLVAVEHLGQIWVRGMERLPYTAGFILGRAVRDVRDGIRAITNFFLALPGNIINGVTRFGEMITEMQLHFEQKVEQLLRDGIDKFTQLATEVPVLAIELKDKVVTTVGEMADALGTLAHKIYTDVTNELQRLPDQMNTIWQNVNNAVMTWFSRTYTGATNLAAQLVAETTNWLWHLPQNAANVIVSLNDTINNGMNNLLRGMTQVLEQISNAWTQMWNDILNFVGSIAGRLRDMAVNAAKSFVSGFLAGLQPGSPFLPERAMMQITQTVTNEVRKVHGAIRDMNSAVTSFSPSSIGGGVLTTGIEYSGSLTGLLAGAGGTLDSGRMEQLLLQAVQELRAIRNGATPISGMAAAMRHA